MFEKLIAAAVLASTLFTLPGCGDSTTVVAPSDRVIKKEVKINDDGSSKTKETTVHENLDGSTTKTERKTETKAPGDNGDTVIKVPGFEVKKKD